MKTKSLADLEPGDVVESYFGARKRVVDVFPSNYSAFVDWEQDDGNIARTRHHYSEVFKVIEPA